MIEFDWIAWDDGPGGNVEHVAENELWPDEVADVLDSPTGKGVSRSSGNPIAFGLTSTGRYIAVVFRIEDAFGVRILTPITAYEVPEP